MHELLRRAQEKVGTWIGSSVIHLGDHNVPNALMFIDKYTQISRILNPVGARGGGSAVRWCVARVRGAGITLDRLDVIAAEPGARPRAPRGRWSR